MGLIHMHQRTEAFLFVHMGVLSCVCVLNCEFTLKNRCVFAYVHVSAYIESIYMCVCVSVFRTLAPVGLCGVQISTFIY